MESSDQSHGDGRVWYLRLSGAIYLEGLEREKKKKDHVCQLEKGGLGLSSCEKDMQRVLLDCEDFIKRAEVLSHNLIICVTIT